MPTKVRETTKPTATTANWVRNGALARHFNVSAMCIWRWKRDASLGCPPSSEVNGVEWNDLAAWDDWMRRRAFNHIERDRRRAKKNAGAAKRASS